MELTSLPTNVILMSIFMLVPAAIMAGVVLTGIAMFFAKRAIASGTDRLRTLGLAWKRSTELATHLSRPMPEPQVARVSTASARIA